MFIVEFTNCMKLRMIITRQSALQQFAIRKFAQNIKRIINEKIQAMVLLWIFFVNTYIAKFKYYSKYNKNDYCYMLTSENYLVIVEKVYKKLKWGKRKVNITFNTNESTGNNKDLTKILTIFGHKLLRRR